jgi:hypothetical protein
VSVEWRGGFLENTDSVGEGLYSDITVRMDLGVASTGWVGIGFGYSDYSMSGSKKAVVLTGMDGDCQVEFFELKSHSMPERVTEIGDPWKVGASCNEVSMRFRIGKETDIDIPETTSSLYMLIAGGLGSGMSFHGANRDYKRINFIP